MKTNAFANLFDLQQGDQNRKDPPGGVSFSQSLDPCTVVPASHQLHTTTKLVGYIRTYGLQYNKAPRRPFLGLLLLFEAPASIAQVSRRRRASTPAEPTKREKKKCDGDMPCDQNVVNIRVQDDHLTRSLFFSPVVAIAPILQSKGNIQLGQRPFDIALGLQQIIRLVCVLYETFCCNPLIVWKL
jgi:hypothetical protein